MHFSPTDPNFVADPHSYFSRLRAEAPVYVSKENGRQVVSVFTHDLCQRVLGDWKVFSSVIPEMRDLFLGEAEIVIQYDPPEHTHARAKIQRLFTSGALAAVRDCFSNAVQNTLVQHQGIEVDFVEDVAAKLAMGVTCQLVGIPVEDSAFIRDWSRRLAFQAGSEIVETDPDRLTRQKVAVGVLHAELTEYLLGLIHSRKAFGVGSLLEVATQEQWPEDEIIAYAKLLLFASNHTSTIQLTTSAYLMARHWGLFSQSYDRESSVGPIVDEIFRFRPAFRVMNRRTSVTTELDGIKIEAGTDVLAWIASANRDPAVFSRPDEYDPLRKDRGRHIGFGYGPHFCLGAGIARLEVSVFIEAILSSGARFEIGDPTHDLHDPWIDSLSSLPFKLERMSG